MGFKPVKVRVLSAPPSRFSCSFRLMVECETIDYKMATKLVQFSRRSGAPAAGIDLNRYYIFGTVTIAVLNAAIVFLAIDMSIDIVREGSQSIAGLLYIYAVPALILVLVMLSRTSRASPPVPYPQRWIRYFSSIIGIAAFFLPMLFAHFES